MYILCIYYVYMIYDVYEGADTEIRDCSIDFCCRRAF